MEKIILSALDFTRLVLAMACKVKKQHIDTAADWLCQVARQTALDIRRMTRTRKKLEETLQAKSKLHSFSEERAVAEDEAWATLYEKLAKPPENQRVVLVLHYLELNTQAEVAGRPLAATTRTVPTSCSVMGSAYFISNRINNTPTALSGLCSRAGGELIPADAY